MQYDAQIDNDGEGNISINFEQRRVVGGTIINYTGLFVVLNLVRKMIGDDPLNNQVFSVKYSYQFDLL